MHVYIHACVYVCFYACMYASTYIYILICAHTMPAQDAPALCAVDEELFLYISIYMHVYIRRCVCVPYTCMHACTHAYVCVYTYTRTRCASTYGFNLPLPLFFQVR